MDATSSVAVHQKKDLVFWHECLNTPQGNSSLLYRVSLTTTPTKSQCWSPVWRWLPRGWAWQAGGHLALLWPSALPTLVPWSSSRLLWVGQRSSGFVVRSVGGRRQGCLSCGHHIPWREAKTDGHQQCGYSVVKQQIPKFMGNGEISRAQSGDVTG